MANFGDMSWAMASGGRLRGLERFGQIWQATKYQLAARLRRRPRAIGASSPGEVERMLRAIELPRTPVVAKAATLVTELGPPALTNHVLRTWAWGTILGLRAGLTWDDETFAVAALLHDLGLARRTPEVTCFAVDGAAQAAALLAEWGASAPVRDTVADAICMHVRVAVPPSLGVEAHLVNAGAGVDVVGARLAEIEPALRDAVLERHPRLLLEDYLAHAFADERQRHPDSRMGLWVALGFLDRIARAGRMF